MTCQRVANDYNSAHGCAWHLAPQNMEQKISPQGGLRPLIGLSPVTTLANTEHWSDTNRKERECLLFLETEENERWPPFGSTSTGFMPNWKDPSVPSRDTWLTFKLTMALIVETFQYCWCYCFLFYCLLYSLINLDQEDNLTNRPLTENLRITKNRYWQCNFISWMHFVWRW